MIETSICFNPRFGFDMFTYEIDKGWQMKLNEDNDESI
jgi:hypothetical protein